MNMVAGGGGGHQMVNHQLYTLVAVIPISSCRWTRMVLRSNAQARALIYCVLLHMHASDHM